MDVGSLVGYIFTVSSMAPDHHDDRPIVAVSAPNSTLGERVVALLEASADVGTVVGIELGPGIPTGAELERSLHGAEVLVHLGGGRRLHRREDLLGLGVAIGCSDAAERELVERAVAGGVAHVVALSSALVYGAAAENPVPLTEAAPARPVLSCPTATACRALEQVVASCLDAHPACTRTVLRTALVAGAATPDWFRSSPWAHIADRPDELTVPLQFVHVDDLAAAIVLAAVVRPDGLFNVAADGWLALDDVRSLRVSRPPRLVRRRPPAGVQPYLHEPWVVANDALRALGWSPTWTNEECFVELDRSGPLGDLSARRRQELALGASGAVVVGAAALGVAALRTRFRRG